MKNEQLTQEDYNYDDVQPCTARESFLIFVILIALTILGVAEVMLVIKCMFH